jgi:hypothetical protein
MNTDFYAEKLQAFLDRKAVPASLQNKMGAQAAEVGALMAAINRHAPKEREGLAWDHIERHLDEKAASRSWPTVNELTEACKQAAAHIRSDVSGMAIDTYAINAERIHNGEPVGDEWLYGRLALELIERRLTTETRLDSYRSGLFFAMRDVWGEEEARRKEAEFKAKHEAAKQMSAYRGEVPKINFNRMAKE